MRIISGILKGRAIKGFDIEGCANSGITSLNNDIRTYYKDFLDNAKIELNSVECDERYNLEKLLIESGMVLKFGDIALRMNINHLTRNVHLNIVNIF